MLNFRVGRVFSILGAGTAGIIGAGMMLGCEAKVRASADDPAQIVTSNQPNGPPRDAGPSEPSATPLEEGQQVNPESLISNGQESSTRTEESCGSGSDTGSCPSTSLCEGDAGSCEATCPGCFIAGACFAADAREPGNTCRICDPERDPRDWSNDEGASCDDGAFCTVEDVCSAGSCEGIARTCEDGVECNGTSTCNEETNSCSAPVSQCGNNGLCDVATDSCVSTCEGCVIEGVCVAEGAEAPGNPCQVCSPDRSTTAYTVAAGKSCGSAATACSGQDTCDAQGRCQTNHLAANASCGSTAASACDQADACDGAGNCLQRVAQNGTPCDDGAFCATGDQCQAGQCVATGQQNCGANRSCNEAADQCQCQGCQVGGTCFAVGASNPANSCQICDPSRSTTALSVNAGAQCGSGATECSGQDTCNAQGQCGANDRQNGSACTSTPGGSCQNGQCAGCNGCRIGGSCVATGTVNPQNPCQSCNPQSNAAGFSANVGANCGSGPTECSAQDTCNAQGQCVTNDRNGATCTGGMCSAGRCTPALQPIGSACSAPAQCQSGFCRLWFEDLDEDSFGNGQRRAMLCSPSPENDAVRGNSGIGGNIRVLSAGGIQYSERGDDCCDVVSGTSNDVRPFNSGFFSLPQAACPSVDPFDYDCSGRIEDSLDNRSAQTSGCPASCDRDIWAGVIPQCGQNGLIQQCRMIGGVCTPGTPLTAQRFCR